MKYTYIALAFLITGFLLAGDAYGEDEVYYCAEIDGNGFYYDKKSGSYEPSRFDPIRFKMKLDRTSNLLELAEGDRRRRYTCTIPYPSTPEEMSCYQGLYHFNFNTKSGRFVYSRALGYIDGDEDSISVSYGTCDKF